MRYLLRLAARVDQARRPNSSVAVALPVLDRVARVVQAPDSNSSVPIRPTSTMLSESLGFVVPTPAPSSSRPISPTPLQLITPVATTPTLSTGRLTCPLTSTSSMPRRTFSPTFSSSSASHDFGGLSVCHGFSLSMWMMNGRLRLDF